MLFARLPVPAVESIQGMDFESSDVVSRSAVCAVHTLTSRRAPSLGTGQTNGFPENNELAHSFISLLRRSHSRPHAACKRRPCTYVRTRTKQTRRSFEAPRVNVFSRSLACFRGARVTTPEHLIASRWRLMMQQRLPSRQGQCACALWTLQRDRCGERQATSAGVLAERPWRLDASLDTTR